MTRPTAVVNGLSKTAKRALAPPRLYSASQAAHLPPRAQPKHVLLRDVPRTALPSDIVRALRDAGAVERDFPVTAIAGPPPSLPKEPSLYKTWHVTLSTPEQAAAVQRRLATRPLFSAESSRTRSNTRSGIEVIPATQGTFASDGTVNQPASCSLIDADATRWSADLIERSLGDRGAQEREREVSAQKGFNVEWACRPGYSGRRVVVKGLPGLAKDDQVRKLARDCGLVDGLEGVKKLPPSRYSLVSTFCFTTNTVADAHRLVRKLHMKWYQSIQHGERYLMRAEMVY
ncbi:hypothetical protein IAU60_005918 [Kwoniella sp. DSM 27419]